MTITEQLTMYQALLLAYAACALAMGLHMYSTIRSDPRAEEGMRRLADMQGGWWFAPLISLVMGVAWPVSLLISATSSLRAPTPAPPSTDWPLDLPYAQHLNEKLGTALTGAASDFEGSSEQDAATALTVLGQYAGGAFGMAIGQRLGKLDLLSNELIGAMATGLSHVLASHRQDCDEPGCPVERELQKVMDRLDVGRWPD